LIDNRLLLRAPCDLFLSKKRDTQQDRNSDGIEDVPAGRGLKGHEKPQGLLVFDVLASRWEAGLLSVFETLKL
jgi:hypothetical protein